MRIKHRWVIEGYDGTERIAYLELPRISNTEVAELLKRLASRHLSVGEIVASSLRRGMRVRATLLDESSTPTTITVGQNPHYIATIR